MTKPLSKRVLKTKSCVRDEKQAVHQVEIDGEWYSLCEGCAVAFQRLVLEFLGASDVDEKLLEFREKPL